MTMTTTFLFKVTDDALEPIRWVHPEDLDRANNLRVVVIDEATWRTEQLWNDNDPFEVIAGRFGLVRDTECVYEPDFGIRVSTVVTRLLADPCFRRDDTI